MLKAVLLLVAEHINDFDPAAAQCVQLFAEGEILFGARAVKEREVKVLAALGYRLRHAEKRRYAAAAGYADDVLAVADRVVEEVA